jgi:gamma-glutamyltranspeptidase/glutathione hydrolase
MFKVLLDAEARKRKKGREEGLNAAREAFYSGAVAEKIVDFARNTSWPDSTGKRNSGLLVAEDLTGYGTRVEDPVNVNYRGIDVYKCGPWTQGPVFLQQLSILEGYDLGSMGHNTYYGDPDYVKVPLESLLSSDYAAERRKLIDPDRASLELRPGNAPAYDPKKIKGGSDIHRGDTTHLDAVDRWGNMISATPSGGWFRSSPVIEGLGFPLGTRMQMFYRGAGFSPGDTDADVLSGSGPRQCAHAR